MIPCVVHHGDEWHNTLPYLPLHLTHMSSHRERWDFVSHVLKTKQDKLSALSLHPGTQTGCWTEAPELLASVVLLDSVLSDAFKPILERPPSLLLLKRCQPNEQLGLWQTVRRVIMWGFAKTKCWRGCGFSRTTGVNCLHRCVLWYLWGSWRVFYRTVTSKAEHGAEF